jgi:hypothetical protein
MSDVFHRDNNVVLDRNLAVYICYLYSNAALQRIEALKGTPAKFTLRIPECDLEICTKELTDPETAIQLKGFLAAGSWVSSCCAIAHRSGGVWQTRKP